jgi:hypothetical protein
MFRVAGDLMDAATVRPEEVHLRMRERRYQVIRLKTLFGGTQTMPTILLDDLKD